MGLERIAMILFSIPDIRLFWSTDARFLSQFETLENGKLPIFKPYSKYPACFKDISFWLPTGESIHDNDFCDLMRDVAGDLVETVEMVRLLTMTLSHHQIDSFTHPKTNRKSMCYRTNFRSMDRSLTNAEVDTLVDQFKKDLVQRFNVEIR